MKNLVILVIVIAGIFSCKTIGIQNQTQTQVELATIGENIKSISKKQFQTNAIPNITNKVRIGLTVDSFTKNSFTTFKQASKKLDKTSNLKYIDSLENKPTFLRLTILDKVALLNNLNNTENTTVFNYLKTATNSKMVTEVSLVFSKNVQKTLQNANEVFLIQNNYKKYALEVVSNNSKQIINFTEATVFDYKTTYFCWAENEKHQIKIADISNKCSSVNHTFTTFKKAKQQKNDFNFLKL